MRRSPRPTVQNGPEQKLPATMANADIEIPLLADDLLRDRARVFTEFLDDEVSVFCIPDGSIWQLCGPVKWRS